MGYPWATGETLLAADLNAAIVAASSTVAAGGPFLPLSGGTLVGSTDATHPFLLAHHSVAGTVPAGQMASWYAFNIDNDSTDATAAQGGGAHGAYIGHNLVAGAKGGRTAFTAFLSQSATTTTVPGQYYVALGAFAQSGHPAGTGTQGTLFAANVGATVGPGSGTWIGVAGMEIDVGVTAGNTVAYKSGLSIVQFANDAVQGTTADMAILIANQSGGTAPGWKLGIAFGGATGWWPFETANSTLIGTQACASGGPAMQAFNGIDLTGVAFVGSAFLSNNFHVTQSGHIQTLAGIDFGAQLSTGPQDFSKHINLYNGQVGICIDNGGNTAYTASASHAFWLGTTQIGYMNSTGINMPIGQQSWQAGTFTFVQTGSNVGPTWTTGSAAPAATAPVGSLYSRVGGAVGATLYVSRGAGTWAAVAGV